MSGQQRNYSFQPMLFADEAGNSMLFVIKPCKDKETLRAMIEYGGGEVVSTPGDHGITLIPPEVEVTGDDEVYSVEYIKDCCKRNKLQDLKPYRLNTVSRFPRDFDVMDILLKDTSWSSALKGRPLTEQTVRTAEASSSGTEFEKSQDSRRLEEVVHKVDDGIIGESQDETGRSRDEDTSIGSSGRQLRNLRNSHTVSFRETQSANASRNHSEGEVVSEDDDELWNQSTKRPKTCLRVPRRRDYTRKEKLAIISFVTKYRFHNYVKGREIWQKAEAAQICRNRTWQSMKEHFIKQIIPNIETYDLSKEEIRKFQKPFH